MCACIELLHRRELIDEPQPERFPGIERLRTKRHPLQHVREHAPSVPRERPDGIFSRRTMSAVAALLTALAAPQERPLPPDQIAARRLRIRERALAQSAYVREPNFTRIHPGDLQRMLEDYDREFLHGRLMPALPSGTLRLGFSQRMTSAGGKTERTRYRRADGTLGPPSYAIRLSSALLFGNFEPGSREVRLSGLPCPDRLDAVQRILEHELVHLAEMLAFDESSCKARRFHGIAGGLFGHVTHTHDLATPRKVAAEVLGIHVGDRVHFEQGGRRFEGRVNRITKRATVLVEEATGQPYSDGKRYAKYMVPLALLTRT
jgi:hypothetical protein